MNTDVNIIVPDTLSLREDLNTSWELLQLEAQPIKAQILERFKDTEDRISETDDVYSLQKLDAFKKFLKAVATHLDMKDILIERAVRNFNAIDESYWTGAIHSEKLIEENMRLKQELESLSLRYLIVENGLRNALSKQRRRKLTLKRAA